MKAQVHQVRDISLAHAHYGVRAAPVNLDRAIGFGDRAACEDDVVDVAGRFPWIFRLQDPRIAHAD